MIAAKFVGIANSYRVGKILALNHVSFTTGLKCAHAIGALDQQEMFELLEAYAKAEDNLVLHLRKILGATEPAKLFLERLAAIIAAQPDLIAGGMTETEGGKKLVHIKHSDDGPLVYVVPKTAFGAVAVDYRKAGEQFPFSEDAVAADLDARGYLIRKDGKHRTVQVRLGRQKMRAWRLKPEALLIEHEPLAQQFKQAFLRAKSSQQGNSDDE